MNNKAIKSYSSAGNNVLLEGYVKGKRFLPHGEVSINNNKGQRLLLGQYLHGKPNGKWFRWYENGVLCSEHHYASGLVVGISKQYWANGTLARECKHAKGFHDYEESIYNKKGEREKHKVYKKGILQKAKIKVRDKWLDFDSDLFRLQFPWEIIPEKICFLDQNSYLKCKTPYQMWCDLNTFLDPETVEAILNQLNNLYSDLSLDTQNTVLTFCGGTFVSTQVSASSPPLRDSDDHNTLITLQESDDIFDACLSVVRTAVASSGVNSFNNNDQGTRDAVNTIDEAVSNCVEDDNSMIAEPTTEALILVAVITAIATAAVMGGKELISYVWDDGWNEEREISPGITETTAADGSGAIRTTDTNRNEVTVDRPGTPQDGNQGGRTVTTTNTSDNTSRTVYYDKDGNPIRVVDKDEVGNELFNSDTDLIGENAEDSETNSNGSDIEMGVPTVTTGGTASRAPSAGQPIDQTGMSKCEQLATRWQAMKDYCELSNWQTYDCQEIIRVFTGCADPALVYPTPDGNGVVCPQESGMTDKEFRQLECERKSMIMVPSGFGNDLCISRGDLAFPERDICSDPAAQCLPDLLVPDEALSPSDGFGFINTRRESQISRRAKREYRYTDMTSAFNSYNSYNSVRDLNEEDFEKRINAKDNKTHFVVFASKSCTPCHKVLNVFNDESQNHKNATFSRVDVSQNPDLSQQFEIRYTPTILVFKHGEMIGQRRVGAASREVLVEYINRAFNLKGKKGKK